MNPPNESPIPDTLARVAARVAERFPADLERIREYLRLPSVSATGQGIRATAAATAAWVQGAGGSFELVETPGHPLLLGELPGPPGAPRLLRYGMYDVQPAEEDSWTSPPFAAEVRDLPGIGPAIVARGSANSKGCLAAMFIASEILNELGGLPATVALFIEGEEELGSPNLAAAVNAHRDDLAAPAAFDLDLTADMSGVPELITGCKGLLTMEIVAKAGGWGGPEIPLHSSEQAWISSPAWQLIHALSTLTDRHERILVDGLADDAEAPADDDEAAIRRLATTFDPKAHLKETKASRFRLEGTSEDLLRALMFEPTMNIDGLAAGYVGPGGKTIIPSEARAAVDIRLVPDMDPDQVAAAVRRHLDRHGFEHVEAKALDRYPWAKAPSGNAVALAIEESYRALGRSWHHYPLAPWCAPYYVFDRILGIPWASGGVGHAAGAHGPDEYATLEGLKEHIVGLAAFLFAYAGTLDGTGATP